MRSSHLSQPFNINSKLVTVFFYRIKKPLCHWGHHKTEVSGLWHRKKHTEVLLKIISFRTHFKGPQEMFRAQFTSGSHLFLLSWGVVSSNLGSVSMDHVGLMSEVISPVDWKKKTCLVWHTNYFFSDGENVFSLTCKKVLIVRLHRLVWLFYWFNFG